MSRPSRPSMQRLLPIAVLFPMLASVVAVLALPGGASLPPMTQLAIIAVNTLIVATVAFVGIRMAQASGSDAADEALQASEDRLAQAAAVHALGIFEWDVKSGRISWAPGSEQRMGLEPGSITDFETWKAFVDPADFDAIMDTLGQAVDERAPQFRYRYSFVQPNGAVRAVEGSSRAYYDADGRLERTFGVLFDITEREEREAALRRREAQLRSILNTVPDAIIVVDEADIIRECSRAAEALWGFEAAEVIGRRGATLLAEEDRTAYRAAIARGGPPHEPAHETEAALAVGETASGEAFPVEYRVGVAHADGSLLITIFYRDIAERLADEERLAELNSELAHVSRQSDMTELAADLAHELNQPLSAIANFLAAARMLAEQGSEGDRIDELLRMGGEQTQRAGAIIRRMRDFMARRDIDMHVESLEQTVRNAAELVLMGSGQFHIRLDFDLDPDAPTFFGDRVEIQQVINNLLRNSLHALRERPVSEREILIGSRLIDAQCVEIYVADNGSGIPKDMLDKLFARFTTTKSNNEGMGIGLSISRRIIERHGGKMTAENRPEGGAIFRFTLRTVGEGECK